MTDFASFAELRAACLELPAGDEKAAAAVAQRDGMLTKPPGSLGRLEDIVSWLARWQRRAPPRLDRVDVLVFAGNHGVVAQGVSAFPADVTRQMVANFAAGGAAINQLATLAGATLSVIPLSLDQATADFTQDAAMDEAQFLAAVAAGYRAVTADSDLICLGEMGIGNTTAAAAVAAALFGGGGARWAGRGTGVDDEGLARKRAAIDAALARHQDVLGDPLQVAAALGGHELAAILGATVAARHHGVPVLIDGFVCTAAVAPLSKLGAATPAPDSSAHDSGDKGSGAQGSGAQEPDTQGPLAHAWASHVSAEAGHRALLEALGLVPLVDLGMRLGEASGAALATLILRAALVCHTGMATFGEAGVSDKAPPGDVPSLPPSSEDRPQ